MGTRSFVGCQVGDKIRAVYVHYDGYLEGVGTELQDYKQQDEVEKLISYGDRSSLGSGYYKERGEDNVDPVEYDSFEDFFEACKDSWGEWYYVFRDGVWYCGTTYSPTPLSSSKLYKMLIPFAEAIESYSNT